MLNEWGLNAHPAVIPNPPTTKRFLGASIGALAGAFVGTLVLNPSRAPRSERDSAGTSASPRTWVDHDQRQRVGSRCHPDSRCDADLPYDVARRRGWHRRRGGGS